MTRNAQSTAPSTPSAKRTRRRNPLLAGLEWTALAAVFTAAYTLSATATTVIHTSDDTGLRPGPYSITTADYAKRRADLAQELGIQTPTPPVAAR